MIIFKKLAALLNTFFFFFLDGLCIQTKSAASVSKSVCLTDLEQFPWRKADGTKPSWSYYVFRIMSELILLPT